MTGVGVVAALEAEARTLGPALRRQNGLAYLGDGAMLAVSGMGGALAAAAARRLVDAGASGLMSFGLAGGLDQPAGGQARGGAAHSAHGQQGGLAEAIHIADSLHRGSQSTRLGGKRRDDAHPIQ